jgi:hypothetical protein
MSDPYDIWNPDEWKGRSDEWIDGFFTQVANELTKSIEELSAAKMELDATVDSERLAGIDERITQYEFLVEVAREQDETVLAAYEALAESESD